MIFLQARNGLSNPHPPGGGGGNKIKGFGDGEENQEFKKKEKRIFLKI